MDEIVEAALRKWPNVPHCHGWLGLDARGDWYLRDERAQAAGAFGAVKGSLIEHEKHKITDEDWRNREKWPKYEEAVDEMVARCSTAFAPWTLVPANSKYLARVTVVETLADRLEKALD